MTKGRNVFFIFVPIIIDDAFEVTESFLASLSLVSPLTTRITVDSDEATVIIDDDDGEFCEWLYEVKRVHRHILYMCL